MTISLLRAAGELDAASAARVGPALSRWTRHGVLVEPERRDVQSYLVRDLPRGVGDADEGREAHEVAWALGDLFASAGQTDLAQLCRSGPVHRVLSAWHWIAAFDGAPAELWTPALERMVEHDAVPARAMLSLSSARALLEAVGDGVELTADGQLPWALVHDLDDRYRWSEEFPWLRPGDEAGLPPLRILREHLVAQGLLDRVGARLRCSDRGRAAASDTALLWRAVVDPSPRWSGEFERDALAVMGASMLRSADFTLGRIGEQTTRVLAGKWRPVTAAGVYDGAAAVAQAWYQLGVPLGWWDTGNGPADRRPNAVGRAAAAAVFGAVATARG